MTGERKPERLNNNHRTMISNETSGAPSGLPNENSKMRVIIADAHACVRELVEVALTLEGGCHVVAHTGLGLEAFERCKAEQAGLLILDPRLADVTGGEIVRQVRAHCGGTRVLVFSGTSSREITLDVLNAGPHGFVHKEESLGMFYDVLRAVMRGSRCYSEYATRLMDGPHSNGQSHKPSLAPREKAVLTLLARGLSSKQIAGELRLSAKTVDHYRTALMAKLNIHEVAGLTRYAVSMGMVNLEN